MITQLDTATYLQVSAWLLGVDFFEDEMAFSAHITALNRPNLPTHIQLPEQSATMLRLTYSHSHELMLDLTTKEAAGVPLLGTHLMFLAKLLNCRLGSKEVQFRSAVEFVVFHTGQPGKDPATDEAVAALHMVTSVTKQPQLRPLILYEYKPLIADTLRKLDRRALTELLVQGFYCMAQYKLDVCLLCLTDLMSWFYFKAKAMATTLQLEWAWTLPGPTEEHPNPTVMTNHYAGLCAAVEAVLYSAPAATGSESS